MAGKYEPYIPQTIDEVLDKLGSMMLSSPRFEDRSGWFQGKSIVTEFRALNEGLKAIRRTVGDQNYATLAALSDRMRAHFEADPEDKTEDAIKGREIILQMEDLLNEVWAAQSKDASA